MSLSFDSRWLTLTLIYVFRFFASLVNILSTSANEALKLLLRARRGQRHMSLSLVGLQFFENPNRKRNTYAASASFSDA